MKLLVSMIAVVAASLVPVVPGQPPPTTNDQHVVPRDDRGVNCMTCHRGAVRPRDAK